MAGSELAPVVAEPAGSTADFVWVWVWPWPWLDEAGFAEVAAPEVAEPPALAEPLELAGALPPGGVVPAGITLVFSFGGS